MATLPYFALSPTALVSAAGFLRQPAASPPAEDWRSARVDVVIPARNEARHIALALASLRRQSVAPRRILVIDDGSSDATARVVEAFAAQHGMPVEVVRRAQAIGKTPTLKRQSRELDGDVQFVLDGDTILDSDDYLARTVEALYQSPRNAAACGLVLPQGRRDRRRWIAEPSVQAFLAAHPWHRLDLPGGSHALWCGLTNLYRGALYSFLQRFIYHGNNRLFGSMTNPVGCAVAYRRACLKEMFDTYEPLLGDDLTNSEDIFLGFALLDAGYHNVQVLDVAAKTVEPELPQLLKQVYLWSSAFLQSCYYFDPLLRHAYARRGHGPDHPRRGLLDRLWHRDAAQPHAAMFRTAVAGPASMLEPRPGGLWLKASAPPPPAAAVAGTATPRAVPASHPPRIGWMPLLAAVEKVAFPTVLLVLALLGHWRTLALTVGLETLLGAAWLAMVMPGRRVRMALQAVAVAPIRYALVLSEAVTIGRFATDLWIRKDRRWRK